MQHPANCLNCESVLNGGEHYCPDCGQKTATHRFTWHHFLHEAWHAITHTDKGLLSLLKGLATNPGRVASEYVGGKHKKYFNPVTFAILSLALMVLANSVFRPYGNPQAEARAQVDTSKLTPKQKEVYEAYLHRLEVAASVSEKHPNIVAVFTFPLEALLFWLFFRRRGRNYVEVLVATVFIGSFATLLFSVVFSPLIGLIAAKNLKLLLMLVGFVGMVVFVAWGMKGFFTNPQPVAFWKSLLVTIVYYVITGVLGILMMFYYVFGSSAWPLLRKAASQYLKI